MITTSVPMIAITNVAVKRHNAGMDALVLSFRELCPSRTLKGTLRKYIDLQNKQSARYGNIGIAKYDLPYSQRTFAHGGASHGDLMSHGFVGRTEGPNMI